MKKKLGLLFITILIVLGTVLIVIFSKKRNNDKENTWYYNEMNLSCIESYKDIKKTKVAFLDTGLNYDLIPYMKNEIVDGYNCILDNDYFHDENGHGTSVISLACFESDTVLYKGINTNIIVVPVVVADKYGVSSEDYMYKGILYAISKNVDIINISMGSLRYSEKVNQALKVAKDSNIIVNCSTGDADSNKITFPANSEYTFAIASQSMLGCKYINSNYDETCILIPGERMNVLKFNTYNNSFEVGVENGSSYSCSLFTSIVAALISIKGDDIKENLEDYFKEYKGIENTFIDMKKILE